jgi:peroxiredoxin
VTTRSVTIALVALSVACAGTKPDVPIWERPGLYGAVRPEMGHPQPGDAAPDFELPSRNGGTFRSQELRGRWAVLHFTASWCPYCDAEVEHLGKLAAEYASRDVRVVLVDIKEDEARWTEYASAHVSPSVIALRDATGEWTKRYAPPHAQPSFDDRAQVMLDTTLILDPKGEIRLFLMPDSKHYDPTFKAVRAELDRFLLEAPPSAITLAPESVVAVESREGVFAAPGATGEIVVRLRVAPGYHVMSDKPSAPEYIATRLRLDETEGLTLEEPRYPPPAAFRLVDHEIATFKGNIEVRVPFHVAPGAAPGPRTIKATLRYQSCTETACLFPATRELKLAVNVAARSLSP